MSTYYPGTDIPLGFVGEARPLAPGEWESIVERLDVPSDHLRAVLDVETGPGGGFDSQGRPWALFEHGVFRRRTSGQYDDVAPDLSKGGWGHGYGKAKDQIDRLVAAMRLDRRAGLESVSLGDGQVMGFNAVGLGYDSVETFAAAMCRSAYDHLDAVARYIEATGLAPAIRAFDAVKIASAYNGPGQVEHYAGLLEDALDQRTGQSNRPPRTLRRFMRGPDVAAAQDALESAGHRCGSIDGVFGPLTHRATHDFQAEHGLAPDGIIGPLTRAALGL